MAARQWPRLALGVVALLYVSGPAWSAPAVLTIAPQAQVQGPHITLGDVAEVQGATPELLERLRPVVLAQAPPTGMARQLSRASILTRLKHHGVTVQELHVQGATQVRVTRAVQHLESAVMEDAVHQAFSQRLPQHAPYTVRDVRGLHPVVLPPGPVRYEVSVPEALAAPGPHSFKMAIYVNDRVEKQLHGTAYIVTTQEVISLTRPVARDEIITADAITRTQIEVTQPLAQIATQPEEVIGKRARRALPSHTPLSTQDVFTAPVVQKGDLVSIVLESSLMKVTAPGEALETGHPGETIRVRNVSSKREVRAQVIDKHTVRIPL